MKYIKTYNEALNEGLLSWLFKKIYKVNFTAELHVKNTNEPVSYKSYITVKAKDDEDARKKFDEKWEDAIKHLDPAPTVIVGNIKRTHKADKTNIIFPKTLKKVNKEKEVKKEIK